MYNTTGMSAGPDVSSDFYPGKYLRGYSGETGAIGNTNSTDTCSSGFNSDASNELLLGFKPDTCQ